MLGLWKQRKGEGLTFPKPVEESPVAVEPIEPIGRIEQVETTELPPIDDNTNVAKTKKISKKKAKALTDGATANISNIAVTAADGEISRDTPTADKLPPVEAAIEIPPSGDDNIAPTITISSNIEPKKRKPPTSKPKKSKVDTPTTTATNTSSVMTVSTLIAMATGTQEAAIPVAHHDDTHIQETIPETAPLPQVAVDIPFVPPSQPLEEILAPMEVDMKYERLHWKIVPASTSRKSNMLLWKYFRVYDASTKCSDTIICTMCYERKRHLLGAYPRQWEVRIGDSKSTSHLAQHLRHQHKEEYQEYVQARELYGKGFRPNKADVSGTFSPEEESTTHLTTFGGVSSGPGGMNQALDQSFTGEETFDGMVDEPSSSHRIEDRFIRSYLHWVIEDCQPLQSCQLSNFTAMWKSSTRKDVNIDIQVLTTAIQQEVQEAKRLLHTIFLSCPVVFSVNSWQDYDGLSYLAISVIFIAPEWDYVSIRLQCKSCRDILSEDTSARVMITNLMQEYNIPVNHVTSILYADERCRINQVHPLPDKHILANTPELDCLALQIDQFFHKLIMQSQVEIILRQLTVACFPYYPSTISWCNLIHHLHDIFANEESKALVGSLMESLSSHEMKKLQRVIKATAPWMKLLEEMMSKGKIVPVINISLCLGLLEEVHWQVQQVMREKDTDNEEEVEFYAWYESKSLMLLHPFTRIVEQFFPKDANEEDSEILRGEYNRLQLLSLAEILDPTVSPSTLIAQQRTWDDVETRLTSIAKVKHAHITTSSASSSSSSTKELSNNVTNSTSKKRKATSDSAAEDVFSSSSLDNKEAGEQSLADKETVSTSSDEVHIHKKGKENEVVEPAVVSENSNKEVPCVTPVPVDSDSSDDSQSVEDKAESIPMPTNAEAEPSSVIPTESEFASIMALRELGYYRQRFYAHSFENNVDDDEVEEVDADLIIPEETSAGRKTGSHSGRMRMTTSDSFKTLAYNYNREPPKSAIAFWRDWEVRMPLLASLARSILCVPVMSLTHTLHSSYQLGQNAFARNPQIMSEMMLLHDVWTQLHDQSSLRTKIRFNSPISSNQPPSMSQPYLTSNSYPSIVFTNSSQTRASIGANHINGLLNDPQSSIDRLVASTSTNNEAV